MQHIRFEQSLEEFLQVGVVGSEYPEFFALQAFLLYLCLQHIDFHQQLI